MVSELFLTENRQIRQIIEKTVIKLLNDNQLMNYNTVNSPRAVGDAVQGFLEKNISQCLPKKFITKIILYFCWSLIQSKMIISEILENIGKINPIKILLQ
jgi:hypothetical protein